MMKPKDIYLVLYNTLCCGGWALLWYMAVQSILTSVQQQDGAAVVEEEDASATTTKTAWSLLLDALANVYSYTITIATGEEADQLIKLADVLYYSQMAALLEILHALVGLVRSPVLVTAMQVGSRIVALMAITGSPLAQSQWGAGLMILSWSSVEVPRYAFYVAALLTGDATKKTPFPLFWLRYSLFAVLYPSGIIGESAVFRKAAYDPVFIDQYYSWSEAVSVFYGTILPIVYAFGSPFMIFNMVANRSSAFKKRFAKPPPPPRGLVWPLDKKGQRSSTETNKAILAAAVGIVNAEKAESILKCKNWRFQYTYHLQELVKEQCKSTGAALKIAQAGLDKAYELFEFVAPDGSAVSFQQAMAAKNSEQFYTGVILGQGGSKTKTTVNELKVPYKEEMLSGQKLKDQVKAWVDYGAIEPSAGDAIVKCVDNPKWLQCKMLSQRHFVLLGAGSAMGPLLVSMALGANIIAIDLDRPQTWKRLIGIAKESSGSTTFPMKVDPKTCQTDEEMCQAAGCNLFAHAPMIRDWLLRLYPGRPFAVGSYAYLDGALHVQVSLAMDAICRDLSEKRKGTSLAHLCMPTDLHLIPKEAWEAEIENYKTCSKKLYCILMHLLSGGKSLRKNAQKPVSGNGGDYYLVNGISVAQGPNYALAKRMQHWRAIIARNKGCIVSSNIAPSTSTVSVVHNRTFAWAYQGMPYFKPFEIFAPETSNSVMSALLFYDLNDAESSGNPKNELNNPNQLFSYGSFNGGVWRCAYEIDSIGEASVFLYFGRVARPYLTAAGAVVAAAAAIYFGYSS